MQPHRIRAVMLRHIYEAWRNWDRITDTIYWPVMNIIVWGFFTLYFSRVNQLSPGVVSFLFGGAILWGMFTAFQRDMAIGFLGELWSRNLVNLFGTPLSVTEYMTGLIAVNFLKAMIGMAAAALVAWVCYAYNIFPGLPAMVPFLLNLIIFALAVGVVITGLIFRYTTRVQGLTWSFTAFLMPLSCVFYPVNSLPKYLQPIALSLPTAHAFEGMRAAIAGGGFAVAHFVWGLALNAAYILLAVALFRRMFDSARSLGLLVKME